LESIALKTAVEQVKAMQNKLDVMGVPVDGPANVYADSKRLIS
jgi:hypothetical protein